MHDIVVHAGLASLGLATAALRELCGYADTVGMAIVGKLWPGPSLDDYDTRVPRLARCRRSTGDRKHRWCASRAADVRHQALLHPGWRGSRRG